MNDAQIFLSYKIIHMAKTVDHFQNEKGLSYKHTTWVKCRIPTD